MALLHADNFTIYGTNTAFMLNGIYANNAGCTLVNDPDGVSGGHVLRPNWDGLNNNLENWRYASQTGAHPTLGAAFRMWNTSLPADNSAKSKIMVFSTVANAELGYFAVLSNGAIRFNVNSINYDTTAPVVSANGWFHVEIKYTLSGSSLANFEVRIEGTTVLTRTGISAINTQPAQVRANWVQAPGGPGQEYFLKDLVVWDNTGTYNADFLGSVLVANLTELSDVSLNWLPSTGTQGWSILDNIPPVDSQYISALFPAIPAPYVGTLSDLSSEVTSVKGLISFVRAAKSDGGDGTLQVGLISDPSGTPATVLGADRTITIAQSYWRDVFEIDPKTSAPWLPAAVNAANIRINRTT